MGTASAVPFFYTQREVVSVTLTDKQKRFVEEYLVDLNATQAAIRAGYSKNTAEQQGCRLLSNVKVQDAIHSKKLEKRSESPVSVDDVLIELKKVGMADASDAQYSELKVSSKLKALELIGKHLGMFEKEYGAQKQDIPEDPLSKALREEAEAMENEANQE